MVRSTGLLRGRTSSPPGSGIAFASNDCAFRDHLTFIAWPLRPPGRSGSVVADVATPCGSAHRAGAMSRTVQREHLAAEVPCTHSRCFAANVIDVGCAMHCVEGGLGSASSFRAATSLSVAEAVSSATERGSLQTCPGEGVIPRAGGRKERRMRRGEVQPEEPGARRCRGGKRRLRQWCDRRGTSATSKVCAGGYTTGNLQLSRCNGDRCRWRSTVRPQCKLVENVYGNGTIASSSRWCCGVPHTHATRGNANDAERQGHVDVPLCHICSNVNAYKPRGMDGDAEISGGERMRMDGSNGIRGERAGFGDSDGWGDQPGTNLRQGSTGDDVRSTSHSMSPTNVMIPFPHFVGARACYMFECVTRCPGQTLGA